MEILQSIRVLGTIMAAFVLALLFTPVLTKILFKYQIAKQIRSSESAPVFSRMHQKKAGTPTMGGILIWFAVFVLAAFFAVMDWFFDGFFGYLNFVDRAQTYLPLAALFIAAAIGFVDDLFGVLKKGEKGGGLTVAHKLAIYAVIAAVGAWWFYFRLDWDVLYVPFFGYYEIGLWYIPIFMFVIVASAFSANETDGLDGLAGGVLLFTFGALTTVSFALGRYDLAAMSGAIMGALLAFLWFNVYPARFFMGDTGSMSLGITMGVIAMLTNSALFLPFFAIIPVIESLSVIVQLASKKLFGRKIFLSTPVHHHFEAIGWPETKVTMRFWIVSVVFTGLGMALFFLARFF